MRLGALPKDRCLYAIKFGTTLHTRCMQRKGHNGPHNGKGLKKFEYQRITWFKGDGREYLSEREDEYAWSPRKTKEDHDG